jgi:hypothetical protein
MISLVYYIQVPPESGRIEFKDPHSWFTDDRAWVGYAPEPGDIIAFDGMLLHRVAANDSKDMRISVGINLITPAEHKRTEWSRAKNSAIPPEVSIEDAYPIINETRHKGTM